MSTNNNNLLNFLQQNSLFSSSPKKNGLRKSKSRSKDRNTESNQTPTKSRQLYNNEGYNRNKLSQPLEFNFNTPLEPTRNYAPPQNNTYVPPQNNPYTPTQNNNYVPAQNNNYVPVQNNNYVPSPQNTQKDNYKLGSGLHDSRFDNFNSLQSNKLDRNYDNNKPTFEPKQNKDVWTGLVSYSTSFQSARIQSSQCLQNLSAKLRNEIANINSKIDSFNSRMYRVIGDEFKNLRERILFIIEESFKESQKYIREYMKSQQQKLAGDLTKMREALQKEYQLVEGMKEEIAKPNWRKTAGEIISNELERKVEDMVKHSSQLVVGRWELGDLVGYRLKDLEKDLRDVVRLKRQI